MSHVLNRMVNKESDSLQGIDPVVPKATSETKLVKTNDEVSLKKLIIFLAVLVVISLSYLGIRRIRIFQSPVNRTLASSVDNAKSNLDQIHKNQEAITYFYAGNYDEALNIFS